MKYVGHFGCSGRLVKLGTEAGEQPRWNAVSVVSPCPACGGEHRTRPMWRGAARGEWARVEVLV